MKKESIIMMDKEQNPRRDVPTPYRVTVTSKEEIVLSQVVSIRPMDVWTLNITAIQISEE